MNPQGPADYFDTLGLSSDPFAAPSPAPSPASLIVPRGDPESAHLLSQSADRPLHLFDLPDGVLSRIISEAVADPRNPGCPSKLLPLSLVSHHMRKLCTANCQTLRFPCTVDWSVLVGWLRFSTSHLRRIVFVHIYDDEEMPPSISDFLPPTSLFSALSFYAPRLEHLDITGIPVTSELDATIFEGLLSKIRDSLTTLVVACDLTVIANAVANSRLHRLVHFEAFCLPNTCGTALATILASFRGLGPAYGPHGSLLKHVHLEMYPSMFDTDLGDDTCSANASRMIHPSVEHLHISAHGRVYDLLCPATLLAFPLINNLVLERVTIGVPPLCKALSFLRNIQSLNILDCNIDREEEEDWAEPGEASPALVQLLAATATILNKLWMPYRAFNSSEMMAIAYYAPPITDLAMAMDSTTTEAFLVLCRKVGHSLHTVGMFSPADNEWEKFSPDKQYNICMGLRSLKELKSFQSERFNFATASLVRILKIAGRDLKCFLTDSNAKDCKLAHVQTFMQLLVTAAKHNPNLSRYCVSVGIHTFPPTSRTGSIIASSVKHLRKRVKSITKTNVEILRQQWIQPYEAFDEDYQSE